MTAVMKKKSEKPTAKLEEENIKQILQYGPSLRKLWLLTLNTLTSVCIFFILFSIHFLRC